MGFMTSLKGSFLYDGRFLVEAPLVWEGRLKSLEDPWGRPTRFVVPVGFASDFDSVPRLPFVYWRLKSRAPVDAAVLHDWLYRQGTPSRAEADHVFYVAMATRGVPWRYRFPIWLGVRLGGWLPWRRYRKRDRANPRHGMVA